MKSYLHISICAPDCGRQFIYAFCLLGTLLILGSGCRTVPFTGRHQLILTTEAYENSLGVEAYGQYKEHYSVCKNTQYNAVLDRVGNALKKVAEQNDYEWEFVVLEAKVANAFCLPGGKVAVYSGIMDIMNNEAELACVVGHEIGHALARHGGERMSWGYLRTFGTLGLIFVDTDASVIFGVGSQLGVMLPFSRKNESEADYIGLMLMAKAGYNPKAAIHFWKRFGNHDSAVQAFFSTHPRGEKRIADLERALPEAMELYRRAPNQRDFGEKLVHEDNN